MNKKLMALALAVCALAATTSLTTIVAKASSAPQETCEQRLARVCEIVAQYRQENGHLPSRLRDIVPEELLRCPVFGRQYRYQSPDLVERYWSRQKLQEFWQLLDQVDWQTTPYLVCACHFDEEQAERVFWFDGNPFPLPREGTGYMRYLGGYLDGRTGYSTNDITPELERVYEWRRNNEEDRWPESN